MRLRFKILMVVAGLLAVALMQLNYFLDHYHEGKDREGRFVWRRGREIEQ